jgi:hypothetical protein
MVQFLGLILPAVSVYAEVEMESKEEIEPTETGEFPPSFLSENEKLSEDLQEEEPLTEELDEVEPPMEQPVKLVEPPEERAEEPEEIPEISLRKDSGEVMVEVDSYISLIYALANTEVSKISITQDIVLPYHGTFNDWTTRDLRDNYLGHGGGGIYENVESFDYFGKGKAKNTSRRIIIEGNNHILDFGSLALCFDNDSANPNSPWDITWQNLTAYHGNAWGFTTLNDINKAKQEKSYLRYKNVSVIGQQMLHAPDTNVTFEGEVTSIVGTSYTSPYRKFASFAQHHQVNLQASALTVKENTKVILENVDTGNISLTGDKKFALEKNARVECWAGNDNTGHNNLNEGYFATIYLNGGVIDIGEHALLFLHSPERRKRTVLRFGSNHARVDIAKGGTVEVVSKAHDGNESIVNLGSDASINVEDDAQFIVRGEDMKNGEAKGIEIGSAGSLTVGKKGNLLVHTDSTNNSSYPIYLGSSNSTVSFTDANTVDIQRQSATNSPRPLIYSTNGKLYFSKQSVKMWEPGNFSDTPQKHWKPMYNISVELKGEQQSNVLTANSLYTSTIDDFVQNFKMISQRLLFERTSDVAITLDTQATDRPSEESSHLVSGKTAPFALVRVRDIPVSGSPFPRDIPVSESENPKFSARIDSNILLPIDLIGDPRKNFSTQADAQGNFSFNTSGRFKADSMLTVYAFLEGKEAIETQRVLDKTAPTGIPRALHWGVDKGLPAPSELVKNPQDTHPLPQNFTYRYVDEEKVKEAMTQLGKHLIDVSIYDNAGNQGLVREVPVMFYQKTAQITGKEVMIYQEDLQEQFADPAVLKAHILKESEPKAQAIIDNQLVDCSELVEVIDLQGLDYTAALGDYKVTLGVKAGKKGLVSDITEEIIVHIVRIKGSFPMHPIEPTLPVVPTEEEPNLPVGGAENEGTGAMGTLRLNYVPSTFDFGTMVRAFGKQSKTALLPKNTEGKEMSRQWLEVYDVKTLSRGWTVSVQLSSPFETPDHSILKGATLIIPQGEVFNTNEIVDEKFQANPETIHTKEIGLSYEGQSKEILTASLARGITTKVWAADKVKLTVPSSIETTKKIENYQTKLNWTLVAGVSE